MKSRQMKEKVDILSLVSYKKLRTVETFEMRHSEKEYNIDFYLKDSFRKQLSFKTPWDGHIYGYAFVTDAMKLILDANSLDYKMVKVYLTDWDSRFVLSIEDKANDIELQYYVSSMDVKILLENCLRIPEQRQKNDL